MLSRTRLGALGVAAIATFTVAASPAGAIDFENKKIRVGLGAQMVPKFPGSDEHAPRPMIDVSIADRDGTFDFEAPDESFGFSLIGDDAGFGIGPAVNFEGSRKAKDVDAPLEKVDFTVEAGAFIQYSITPSFRLRAEGRKGLGGHDGWIGTISADYIARDGDAWLFSIGPRLTLADDTYHRSYFSVSPVDSLASGLPEYDADGGILSYGAAAGAEFQLSQSWGLFGYAKYDRLTGDAADSPITRALGDRDQFSGGIGLTYTFFTGG